MISANIPNNIRKMVYRRDGYRCALCDSTMGLQIHHYVHRSHGGTNRPENLICLCWMCHAEAHGTKLPEYGHMTQEEIEQAIVEYLADFYAPDWYPDGTDFLYYKE